MTWLDARSSGRNALRYDPTPTAWDWAVDHGTTAQGFVRVLGPDGTWKGGEYGAESYFASYPTPPALFVQRAWLMAEDGTFVRPQDGSCGAWIPCDSAPVVEFLAAPEENEGEVMLVPTDGGIDGSAG